MGTFNRTTTTQLRTGDPRTDHHLPHPRSLAWSEIASRTALSGLEAQHAELLHGDQWQELQGDVIENIHKSLESTIGGSEVHKVAGQQNVVVSGNHKETFAQSCSQSILGPQVVMNGTVRSETRLGAANEVYGGMEIHDSHDGQIVYGDSHDERYNHSFAIHGQDEQKIGAQFGWVWTQAQLVGISGVVRGIDASFAGAHGELTGVHFEVHVKHMESHGPPKPTSIPPEPAFSSQPPFDAVSHIE